MVLMGTGGLASRLFTMLKKFTLCKLLAIRLRCSRRSRLACLISPAQEIYGLTRFAPVYQSQQVLEAHQTQSTASTN